MSDLTIDPITGDFAITNGEVTLEEGSAAIRQRLEIKLRTFLGEWFLDTTFGIPYYEQVLGKKVNPISLNAVFVSAILTVSGIKKLDKPITYDFNPSLRKLDLSFVAILDTGESVGVSLSVP